MIIKDIPLLGNLPAFRFAPGVLDVCVLMLTARGVVTSVRCCIHSGARNPNFDWLIWLVVLRFALSILNRFTFVIHVRLSKMIFNSLTNGWCTDLLEIAGGRSQDDRLVNFIVFQMESLSGRRLRST